MEGIDQTAHGIMKEGSGEMKAKAIILLTALGVLMVSVSCLAETASGDCGTRVTWTYSDGTLTISGEGEMANYTKSKVPWKEYRETIQTVIVNQGVTAIGNHAFNSCVSLTDVTLPEGLTRIGAQAFYSCTSLPSISLPDAFTDIGSYAFGLCEGLSQITLPDSLRSIGDHAFYHCSALSSFHMPDSVISIQEGAFAGSGLSSIRLSEKLDTMGPGVFQECMNLNEITWPASMSSIPPGTFAGSSIKVIILQEGTSKIEDRAFQACEALTEVYLPVSVTSIGDYSFDECSNLKDVYYAGTELQKNGMTKQSVTTNTEFYNAAWHYAESGECARGIHHLEDGICQNCGRSFDISGMTVVQLPEDLTVLGAEALRGTGAQVVIVPAGCTEIGSRAFADCPDLQYVLLPEGVAVATDVLSGTEAELLYR